MRRFQLIVSALSAGVLLAPVDMASAQTTPSDVRDLIGVRGSSGEAQLQQRGYENTGGQVGSDRGWTYWWNARRGVCLTVATVDGRYQSIVSGPSADCRRDGDRPTTLPGPVGGPVASGPTETIQFARGTSSATRRGAITGYETRTYLLTLRAGQTLNVTMQTSNRSNSFNITAPGAQQALFNGSSSGARYSGRTRASGVYRIEVYLMRNAARRGETARYTLNVGAR